MPSKSSYCLSILSLFLIDQFQAQTGAGCFLTTCPIPGQVRIDANIVNGVFQGGCNCECAPEIKLACKAPRSLNYDTATLTGDCSCNCPAGPTDPKPTDCVYPSIWDPDTCSCGCPTWAPAPTDCVAPQVFRKDTCSCGCSIGNIGGPCNAGGTSNVRGSFVTADCTCDTTLVTCPGNQVADATGKCGCPEVHNGLYLPTCALPLVKDPLTCDCVTTTTTKPPMGPANVLCETVGDCMCPWGTRGTCTMTCDVGNDACKDGTLTCNNDGYPCIVNCLAGSACAGAAKIIGPIGGALQVNCIGGQACEGSVMMDGSKTTDGVQVTCDGGQSCKGSVTMKFGMGDNRLACNGVPDGCVGMGAGNIVLPADAATTPNVAFTCTGNCPPGSPANFNNLPLGWSPANPIGGGGAAPVPGVGVPVGPQAPQQPIGAPQPPLGPQAPLPPGPVNGGGATNFPQAPIGGSPAAPFPPQQPVPPTIPGGVQSPGLPGSPNIPQPQIPLPQAPLPNQPAAPMPPFGANGLPHAPLPPQPAVPGGKGAPMSPGAPGGVGGSLVFNSNPPIPIVQPEETVVCSGVGAVCGCTGTRSCTIKCEHQDDCKEASLNCPANHDCTVVCMGDASCVSAKVTGPINKDFTLNCAGISSCVDSNIMASSAWNTAYTCSGKDACKGATKINCGAGDCEIACPGEAACDSASLLPNAAKAFFCSGAMHCPPNYTSAPVSIPTPPPTPPCQGVTCGCNGALQCFEAPNEAAGCRCECPLAVLTQEFNAPDPNMICGADSPGQVYLRNGCGCDCPLGTNVACNAGKIFNQNTCQCECPGGNLACRGKSVLNQNTCQCECPLTGTPTDVDCNAVGKVLRDCECSCPLQCPSPNQIQDPLTCQCQCPPSTPTPLQCPSGAVDAINCECVPEVPSPFACHPGIPGFKPWRGRCWGYTTESGCNSEANGRCVWKGETINGQINPHYDPLPNPPVNDVNPTVPCKFRDAECIGDGDCCSETCRLVVGKKVCR